MDLNIDITSIVNSAQDGQWLLFAGLLLMAFVQVVRSLMPVISKNAYGKSRVIISRGAS